jgi:hypothetical protein
MATDAKDNPPPQSNANTKQWDGVNSLGAMAKQSLLPTPSAGSFNDGESLESWQARQARQAARGINGNGMGTPLPIAVQLLKTPTAQLAVNGGSQHPDKRREGGHGPTLADQVEHLLPTPTSRDGKGRDMPARQGGSSLPDMLLPTPRATDGTKGGPNQRGSSGDLMLPSAVMDLLPTPNASDWKGSGQTQGRMRDGRPRPPGDSDLPEAVALLPTPTVALATGGQTSRGGDRVGELLLAGIAETASSGVPTIRPSADGKPSSGAPLPGQLSLGELAKDSPPDLSSSSWDCPKAG